MKKNWFSILACYSLIYIVMSFAFHLHTMIEINNFTRREILWLSAKIPVLVFCLIALARSAKK